MAFLIPVEGNLRRHIHEESRALALLWIIANHVGREAQVKRHHALQLLNLLVRKMDLESLDVVHQMLNLPPPDDREHIRGLLHDVREGDGGQRLDAVLLRHLLQRRRRLFLVARLVAAGQAPQALALLLALLDRLFRPGTCRPRARPQGARPARSDDTSG